MHKNGKKKTEVAVAYTPLNTAENIPQIVEQKVQEIPRYEDSGVKYQGKYKVQQGQNAYELRGQQTRFYACAATALGKTTFTRANKGNTRFFCTKMIVQMMNHGASSAALYDSLFDSYNGVDSLRAAFWYQTTDTTFVLDLTDCPRLFLGDIVINKSSTGGTDFTAITLFGWEEQV